MELSRKCHYGGQSEREGAINQVKVLYSWRRDTGLSERGRKRQAVQVQMTSVASWVRR